MATVDVFGRRIDAPNEVDFHKDVLAFGRPGYGAPLRTKSGRPVTLLKQDPIIRYNSNAENSFLERYERKIRELRYSQPAREPTPRNLPALDQPPMTPSDSTTDYYAPYTPQKNNSATTMNGDINGNHESNRNSPRQTAPSTPKGLKTNNNSGTSTPKSSTSKPTVPAFIVHRPDLKEKLGWVNNSVPSYIGISKYRDCLQEQLKSFADRRKREEEEYKDAKGTELVAVFCQKLVGQPRRDPITGDMGDHHLGSTDITAPRPFTSANAYAYEFLKQDPADYRRILEQQQQDRIAEETKTKAQEKEIFKVHCRTWSSFWGRPGYGAPTMDTTHKRNLLAMLHDVRYFRKPQSLPEPPKTAPNPTRKESGQSQQAPTPRANAKDHEEMSVVEFTEE